MENEITELVNNNFKLNARDEDVVAVLSAEINRLIIENFDRLIQILYRADINEKLLKKTLAENKDRDAGLLIAKMYIEREKQKIKSRRENRRDPNDINDCELL